MKRVIVGTAGHIDHGKTRLIEALTGIDCDRWEEEKRRGITIDLGFAHLETEELQIGFVDVPGHERFLDNALAGLGGIRVMLLVVAADEGVKPQTREHLAICSLLDIPCGLVALTKSDLVTPDTLEIAQLEVEELLAPTQFADAASVAVSSVTGDGVAELKDKLLELADQFATAPDPDRPTRLPVDRVFVLKGLGQVVTGTLTAGEVAPGDSLTAMPGDHRARVRSVQVHGNDREKAKAGERTALRVTGVEPGDLARGTQLTEAGSYLESKRLLARLSLLTDAPSPLDAPTSVRVHLGTAETLGRLRSPGSHSIAPGTTGTVEIRLARPTGVARGDHFIIRRPSPPLTLGGGVVLDPMWYPRRGARLQRSLERLEGDDSEAVRLWIEDAGASGLSTEVVAQRLGVRSESAKRTLDDFANRQKLISVPAGQGHGQRWLVPSAFESVVRRAKRVLHDHFGKDRLAESMSKAEAVERILPGKAAELADVYFDWLRDEKVLVIESGQVSIPGRTADLSAEESHLTQQLLTLFEEGGLSPPSPLDLKQATAAKPQVIEGIIRYLRQGKKLVQLPGGLLIATSAIEAVCRELASSGETEFSVGDFKNRFGLSRKWAIPLLEHLDSIGFTRRVGNSRQIVGATRQEDS
jgi:selenocysteine-specific elongation factor